MTRGKSGLVVDRKIRKKSRNKMFRLQQEYGARLLSPWRDYRFHILMRGWCSVGGTCLTNSIMHGKPHPAQQRPCKFSSTQRTFLLRTRPLLRQETQHFVRPEILPHVRISSINCYYQYEFQSSQCGHRNPSGKTS
jgi:hypothetical protein